MKPLSNHYRLNLPGGDAVAGETISGGVLANTPVVPGTIIVDGGAGENFTDNGDGTLSGDAGGSGTINYFTGAIDVVGTADYQYVRRATKSVTAEETGVPATDGRTSLYDGKTQFGGQLANYPVIPGTVDATLVLGGSASNITDNGNGTLSGDGVQSGSIDYNTGNFHLIFDEAPGAASQFSVSYQYGIENRNEKLLATGAKGVFAVKVTNRNDEDADVAAILIASSDMVNWRVISSVAVGQGDVKIIKNAGVSDNLKVIGAGGSIDLSFLN